MIQLNGEEILRPRDPPRYRYACGILFPNGVTYSGSLDATEEAADIETADEVVVESLPNDDEQSAEIAEETSSKEAAADSTPEVDSEMNAASMFLPSTMGISFLADVSGGLLLEAYWGTYRKEPVSGYPGVLGSENQSESNRDAEPWFRIPGKASIPLSAADLTRPNIKRSLDSADAQGSLVMDVVSRPWKGKRLITVTLINASVNTKPVNENCFFQCKFSVHPQGNSRIEPYPGRPESLQDPEERSLSLLYRHRPNYAVGHGCSADWTLDKSGVVQEVRTEVLPIFEQAPILPRESIDGGEMSMKFLSEGPIDGVLAACTALADAYRKWVDAREAEAAADATLGIELREAANKHISYCRQCLGRIEEGITVLRSNVDAMDAFRLMNRAMMEQRDHYELSTNSMRSWIEGPSGTAIPERPYVPPVYSNTKWRPFQLAFILMN
ncbi:MAG: hypothetical protein ABI407_17990, partial [Bradyrhizobium sp.]